MPDRLLYALSTREKMSFSNFEIAFNTIYPLVHKSASQDNEEANFTFYKFQTLRFLDALGHCEYDFSTRYVYACPPYLVLLPGFGLPKAILTGARSPELLHRLKMFVKQNKSSIEYREVSQRVKYLLLPKAILLESISKDLFKDAAESVKIGCLSGEPAAWCLLNYTIDIEKVKQSLSFSERAEIDWPRRTFLILNLSFNKYASRVDDYRLVEYTNPITQQRLHFLWDGKKAAQVDRDWGRYLILAHSDLSVLLYDAKRFLLAVPSTAPLPRLIARALTLCTGLSPAEAILKGQPVAWIPASFRFNIYEAVLPSIAGIVSERLGQKLMDFSLAVDEDGVIR